MLDTIDRCGFVGRNPGNEHVWIVTGDSGQGMTQGAMAGLLLRKLVLGEETPWAEVYNPGRTPVSGALNYLQENLTAVKNSTEYLTGGEIDEADDLKPGEGGILDRVSRSWPWRATRMERCTGFPRAARTLAASCTGTAQSNAGIARATARSSRRTARC